MAVAGTDRVWYAAYGSNLCAARLACYLGGGTPAGARRAYRGCRDPRPPLRAVPLALPGSVYFAWESTTWTGGMAFYDPGLPGTVAGRGYLLGVEQFLDIAVQEMHRSPGGLPPHLVAEAATRDRTVLGPGRYETVVRAGIRDGVPVLTFTAPWRARDVPWRPPAAGYLATIATGLRESHGWDARRIARYLGNRPGVAGAWRRPELFALVTRAVDLAAHHPVGSAPAGDTSLDLAAGPTRRAGGAGGR